MIPESILSFFHAGKSLPFRSMTFFNFLLEATLAGSILIIVMLILRRAFRKQIGSRLVYLAWVLVAVRLLLPIALPNPLMDEFRPTESVDAGARPVADQIRVRYHDAMSDISYWLGDAAEESGSQPLGGLSLLTHDIATYSSYGWLGKGYLLGYAVGGLVVAAMFSVRHLRFRRRLKNGIVSTLEGEQLVLYHALCEQMGVTPLPVYYADPLPSPCLVGVLKPVIALPLMLPPESLREALLHELCHFKARDPWWSLLRCVCCAVHWFNPLVWLAQRFIKADCEFACDERVALRLSEDERLHYANTLVLTAKQPYAPRTGVLATGMTMTGKRLKQRVNAILHLRAVRKAAAIILAALLALLTIAAFSTAESTAQQKSLTTAFPFAKTDIYEVPVDALGEAVALSPLTTKEEAEAQALRYIAALYPQEYASVDPVYKRTIQSLSGGVWRVVFWPPQDIDAPQYSLDLTGEGALISLSSNAIFDYGTVRTNTPSVLPLNISDALLAYGQRFSSAVMQGSPLISVQLHSDVENSEGRYLVCDFASNPHVSSQISMTVQIAPTFRPVDVYDLAAADAAYAAREEQSDEEKYQTFTYSKDETITFETLFWGDADRMQQISPHAALTSQQAFDIAVALMLQQPDLSTEDFLDFELSYGYFDRSLSGGDMSLWRFQWQNPFVDDYYARYHLEFSDELAPTLVTLVEPGEELSVG